MSTGYIEALNKLLERANKALGKETAAPLSTKQRKKMKESTFCGPGRSFPVPDCKHVAVAKTYLARAKFSKSTKDKIAACINRKAKALGCDVSKKAKAYVEYSYDALTKEQKALYDSDAFEITRDLVDASIETPDLDLFCGCGK